MTRRLIVVRSCPAQRGAAVVAALLVLALVTIVGAKMLMQQEIWLTQVEIRKTRDGALENATASLLWARAILNDDGENSTVDHSGESWARPMPSQVYGDSTITGWIESEQGKFDLNSLVLEGKVNASAMAAFGRLLSSLGLPGELANAVLDWIDADNESSGAGGAEKDYYSGRTPPCRPPNSPLASLEELLYIRGFNPGVLAKLKPHVTALPALAPLNVNLATPEVLAAMNSGMTIQLAKQLLTEKKGSGFATVDEFKSKLPLTMQEGAASLAVQGEYFLVHGEVTSEANGMRLVYKVATLLQRKDKKWPVVIWQRLE